MDRAYRIANLWNWLPAFRTVAETQHLPSAAEALHVSASALSRAVKQLEGELGFRLFDRDGRRIRLNRAGEELLGAVRDAMRLVDDGLGRLGTPAAGRVRIAGAAPWLELIALPALTGCALPVDMISDPLDDAIGALRRGDVDLVIGDVRSAPDDIVVEHLGTVAHAVCTHPAARELRPFAVWTALAELRPPDATMVALRTPHLAVVLEACASGRMQAVLPVAIARAHGLAPQRTPSLPAAQLYLARRAPLAHAPLCDLAAQLRTEAARVLPADS